MASFSIERVLVERGVEQYRIFSHVRERTAEIPQSNSAKESDRMAGDYPDMGKKTLHLLEYNGELLKPCPGTTNHICCGYQILNVATNCPLDCSYCILQSYFNEPNLRVFTNLAERLEEVFNLIENNPDKIFRIGTGEFTDSLALDPLIGWTDILVPPFSKRKNAILELKTKTVHIEKLLALRERDQIIVSWSLNSPTIAATEEHRAPSLKKRIEAAAACQSEGFLVGFHFDPLIPHPNWQDDYLKTIDLMARFIDPARIIWISMGSFRFMPPLKAVIRQRHPHTSVLDGEFVRGLDGKMRYFKPIRMELYRFMREHLEAWHNDLGLYLCMESDEIWRRTMGWTPKNTEGLSRFLDERVKKFFG
ncbi:MAG: DNA photolyase [Deltaproteobacteria bacterium]|nr:DNA photolyase [Deltaproteobacteria bacterium]